MENVVYTDGTTKDKNSVITISAYEKLLISNLDLFLEQLFSCRFEKKEKFEPKCLFVERQ